MGVEGPRFEFFGVLRGPDDLPKRALIATEIQSVNDWPDELQLPPGHFALLIAGDLSSYSDFELKVFADKLHHQGCASVVIFETDSDRFHDIYDHVFTVHDPFGRAFLPGKPESAYSDEGHVMTASGTLESIEHTVWEFLFVLGPIDAFRPTCLTYLSISVGDMELAARIRRGLSDPIALQDEVVGPDDDDDNDGEVEEDAAWEIEFWPVGEIPEADRPSL